MLVRKDRIDNAESHGRRGDYSGRSSRPDRRDNAMERSVSSAPQTQVQAKTSPTAHVEGGDSIPETPRAAPAKKPRQSKPSA
jgi:hypothetical protein